MRNVIALTTAMLFIFAAPPKATGASSPDNQTQSNLSRASRECLDSAESRPFEPHRIILSDGTLVICGKGRPSLPHHQETVVENNQTADRECQNGPETLASTLVSLGLSERKTAQQIINIFEITLSERQTSGPNDYTATDQIFEHIKTFLLHTLDWRGKDKEWFFEWGPEGSYQNHLYRLSDIGSKHKRQYGMRIIQLFEELHQRYSKDEEPKNSTSIPLSSRIKEVLFAALRDVVRDNLTTPEHEELTVAERINITNKLFSFIKEWPEHPIIEFWFGDKDMAFFAKAAPDFLDFLKLEEATHKMNRAAKR